MLIKVQSTTNSGLDTIGVDVEVNVAGRGLPGGVRSSAPNNLTAEIDVRIYDYARTPQQIMQDYNAGAPAYFKQTVV